MALLPIFFIHKGSHRYLWVSIMHARKFNPDSQIILIGDEAAKKVYDAKLSRLGISFGSIDDYLGDDRRFRDLYIHYSVNKYEGELFCIERWMILKNYLKKHQLEKAFYLDTDILLYTKITEDSCFCGKVSHPEAGGMDLCYSDSGRTRSLHTCYFTQELLTDFCNYIYSMYESQEKRKQIEDFWTKEKKSFCDMTLCTWFFRERDLSNIIDFAIPCIDSTNKTPAVFDSIIWETLDYLPVPNGRMKEITWKKKLPYVYKKTKGCLVRMKSLHFQGNSKRILLLFSCLPYRVFLYLADVLDEFFFRLKRKLRFLASRYIK